MGTQVKQVTQARRVRMRDLLCLWFASALASPQFTGNKREESAGARRQQGKGKSPQFLASVSASLPSQLLIFDFAPAVTLHHWCEQALTVVINYENVSKTSYLVVPKYLFYSAYKPPPVYKPTQNPL